LAVGYDDPCRQLHCGFVRRFRLVIVEIAYDQTQMSPHAERAGTFA
jgi:hypothetical protein